jgi:superfamily II DNA helicase RecQ
VLALPEGFSSVNLKLVKDWLQRNIDLLVLDEADACNGWRSFRPELGQTEKVFAEAELLRLRRLCMSGSWTTRSRAAIQTTLSLQKAEISNTQVFSLVNVFPLIADQQTIRKELVIMLAKGKIADLSQYVRHLPVIIFAHTTRHVTKIATELQKKGLRLGIYTANVIQAIRQKTEESFANGKIDVLVCTLAFGLVLLADLQGIDNKEVENVVVFHLPDTLETLYQMLSRAGRAGQVSQCVVLWSGQIPKTLAADSAYRRFLEGKECLKSVTAEHMLVGDSTASDSGAGMPCETACSTCDKNLLASFRGCTCDRCECSKSLRELPRVEKLSFTAAEKAAARQELRAAAQDVNLRQTRKTPALRFSTRLPDALIEYASTHLQLVLIRPRGQASVHAAGSPGKVPRSDRNSPEQEPPPTQVDTPGADLL